MGRLLCTLCIIFAACAAVRAARKRRSPAAWQHVDVDAWEDKLLSAGARQEALPAASQAESSEQQVGGAAWDGAAEAGGYAPEPFELTQTEDEVLIAQMDSRKQMGARVLGAHASEEELKEWARHQAAASGPTMLFVHLTASWTSFSSPGSGLGSAIEALAVRWQELLKTAGLEVTVYDVGNSRLMVALQQGWHGLEVKNFLAHQAEVAHVEWDGVKYARDDDLATPRAPRAKRRKARAHKSDTLRSRDRRA